MTTSQKLQKAKQLAIKELLSDKKPGNVVGVGIGKKSGRDCLRFYMVTKLDQILSRDGFFRKSLRELDPLKIMQKQFPGIPLDFIEIGQLGRKGHTPRPDPDPKTNPIPTPGSPIRVNTAVPNVNSGAIGTLGMAAMYGSRPYLLSCNHILAVNGRVLEDSKAEVVSAHLIGDEMSIAQPTVYYLPLDPNGGNFADCALAYIKDTNQVQPRFPDLIGTDLSTDPVKPALGQKVKKVGAATNVSEATIVDVSADFYIDYDFGRFRLNNQVVIDSGSTKAPFALQGDSGSVVWATEKKHPVAIVVAGSGQYAVASPLTKALPLLEAKIRPDGKANLAAREQDGPKLRLVTSWLPINH